MSQYIYDFNYDLMEMHKDPEMKKVLGKPVCFRRPLKLNVEEPVDEIVQAMEGTHKKIRKQGFKYCELDTPMCKVMNYLQLSCSELSRRVRCHPSSINRIRSGRVSPSVRRAYEIVRILNQELGETIQVTVNSLWPGKKLMEKPYERQ